MADAERQKQVNKVLFSAAKSYWEWFFKYQQLRNAELAFSLASERYNAVRVRILVGDLASIDSVEALIFRQDRELFLNQARIEEQNARLDLSSFFWSEDEKPLDLLLGTRPVLPAAYLALWSDSTVAEAQRQAITNHPEIQKIAIKTRSLELDRSLGREMLKPLVQVNYSWLSRTDQSVWATQTLDRNYKFGFDFALPLFLRKERGKLGLVKTKLLQNNLDFQQAQRDLNISIQMSANEMRNLNQQIEMQNAMVENYQKLRNAEIRKFENGESSLFLINSREAKLIESIIKQASLVSKFQKERAALLYAAGRNALLPF
jgi:outer membrane protein TolC